MCIIFLNRRILQPSSKTLQCAFSTCAMSWKASSCCLGFSSCYLCPLGRAPSPSFTNLHFSSWPVSFIPPISRPSVPRPFSIPANTLERRPVAHEKHLALIPPLNYRDDIIICHMGHIPSGLILQLCVLWI